MIGSELWDLYADHRAWSLMELTSKKSYGYWIRRFLKSGRTRKLEPIYFLLWCFSARHRANQRVSLVLSVEDRIMGALYPADFLDLLPQHSEEFAPFRALVQDMLLEADLISVTPAEEASDGEAGEAENPTLTPAPETGTGEDSTSSTSV